MGKTFIQGNWVLTRDGTTPDSERDITRDDPLFDILKAIFKGEQTELDLAAIAATKGMQAEDVFIDIHEHYGYICIGTGENPAFNETLSDAEKIERQVSIKKMLETEKLPHILIKGKYLGVEEYSYFVPFNNKTIGLPEVLQSDLVRKVEAIAAAHRQDSLLICQNGHACYLYTSGPQKGQVITGRTAVVYPGQSQLPDDCYSLFFHPANKTTVGFTCVLNFNRIYNCIEEYADSENKTLQQHYDEYVTALTPIDNKPSLRKKMVILLRGTDGYNAYAMALKKECQQSGLRAEIVGTDANIAKVNEEVAEDNKTKGAKAGWEWPQIRDESLRRNREIYNQLIQSSNVDVVIYADMNKFIEYMLPYISAARQQGHEVVSLVVNSFVFEPHRSDYVEKLCQQFGNFMGRHVADFKNEKSQINAKQLVAGEISISQYRDLSPRELVRHIQSIADKPAAATLASGKGPTVFACNDEKLAIVPQKTNMQPPRSQL